MLISLTSPRTASRRLAVGIVVSRLRQVRLSRDVRGFGGYRRDARARLVALAVVGIATAGCTLTDVDAGSDYALYFLGGQSNMDGYGFVDELPAVLRAEAERVMIYTGRTALDDEPGGGVGAWAPLRPGHGTGFTTDGQTSSLSDRFGPELSFGRSVVARRPDSRIAIVKYSLGGSGLAPGVGYGSWDPDYADGKGINQYDHALRTIRDALAVRDIDGDGRGDRLVPAGIVWMQGEADAYDSQAAADAYRANLARMMSLLRAALGAADLPVVIGRITDSGMADDGSVMDYIGTVQEAQAAFAEADTCASLVTITDELGYLDDGWHYDSDGYLRMGKAFADAVLQLQARCPAAADGRR